ncbi:MAG: hypothetical protein GF364_14080 [Candidatus Lokiarchaeota archaeon]|nr:hypothetical protein [Candidatus Lokiarchaeota archaeon]
MKYIQMFEQDIRDKNVPTIQPSSYFFMDPNYSGNWLVTGDLTGDGQLEFVSARNDNQIIKTIIAYNQKGEMLWHYGTPNTGTHKLGYDIPLQLYDLNNNGKCEVIFSERHYLAILNGEDGTEQKRYKLPDELECSDCICFANLSGNSYPSDIIIKSRYRKLWAYTSDWELLWSWTPRWGRKTCHYPTPVDIDNDGRDEIFAGRVMLNHNGKKLWKIKSRKCKRRGHLDCVRIVSTGEKPEDFRFILSYCGAKYIALINGLGKVLWDDEDFHFESIDVGYFNEAYPAPQFYVDIDHLGFGKSLGFFYDLNGSRIGTIKLDYGRHHRTLDWTGNGLDEVVIANELALVNGEGERIARFQFKNQRQKFVINETEHQILFVSICDLTGKGNGDIIFHTGDAVNIYLNPSDITGGQRRFDTENFTFY